MTRARARNYVPVSLQERFKSLRALYFIVYNDERPLGPLSVELFHAIGQILEGVPPEQLELNKIDKDKFLREREEE